MARHFTSILSFICQNSITGVLSSERYQHDFVDEETEGRGLAHRGAVWLQGPLSFHHILWS